MPRKLPVLTEETRPFWTGGETGRLLIHRCGACARYFHPPAPVCPRCRSLDVAPEAVSGRGRVLASTINHQPWTPELTEPYVVAIVELAEQEGLRFLTNIVNCAPEEVATGREVTVAFAQTEDVFAPVFELVR